jgi:hypothetical protein
VFVLALQVIRYFIPTSRFFRHLSQINKFLPSKLSKVSSHLLSETLQTSFSRTREIWRGGYSSW